MLTGWDRFKGWSVLEFFLENPTTEIHVKALARALNVSPLTANTYLKAYLKDGILSEKRRGNALFYSLVDYFFTKELKRAFVLSKLMEKNFVGKVLEDNPSATSIVLYGTRASGNYDERSDYDILVFSKDKKFPKKAVAALTGETNLKVLSLAQWRALDENFKKSVAKNNVVLYGANLVLE
ncbi:nucleotidyltransferase domain-containing protein [Candidatus Micrarchaeota archaeon]|nr:nucleotidyltransferase domain-containing protein [Candidatus Micrarchaeota archaeon]